MDRINIHANRMHKNTVVAIVILDKIGFKIKNKPEMNGPFCGKSLVHQEDITIVNV